MGFITNFLYEHPDRFLAVVGTTAGFGLGAMHLDWWMALVAGLLFGLFTLAIANIEPHDDVTRGPHQ